MAYIIDFFILKLLKSITLNWFLIMVLQRTFPTHLDLFIEWMNQGSETFYDQIARSEWLTDLFKKTIETTTWPKNKQQLALKSICIVYSDELARKTITALMGRFPSRFTQTIEGSIEAGEYLHTIELIEKNCRSFTRFKEQKLHSIFFRHRNKGVASVILPLLSQQIRDFFFEPTMLRQTFLLFIAENNENEAKKCLLLSEKEPSLKRELLHNEKQRIPLLLCAVLEYSVSVPLLLESCENDNELQEIFFNSIPTPLHAAIWYHKGKTTDHIIEFSKKHPKLHSLIFCPYLPSGATLLHMAVFNGDLKAIKKLIAFCKDFPNLQPLLFQSMTTTGLTPLLLAIATNNMEVCKTLVEACKEDKELFRLLVQPGKNGMAPQEAATKIEDGKEIAAYLETILPKNL